MESLLKLEHVTICYNGEPVVHDVDLELNKGELLVEMDDKTVKTVISGEVSVRGIYGYV